MSGARLVFRLILVAAIAVGSVAFAAARAEAALAREAVICTGAGVATLVLDGKGRPVAPVHPCPDCLAGMTAALPPAVALPPRVAARTVRVGRAAEARPRARDWLPRRARGPPDPSS